MSRKTIITEDGSTTIFDQRTGEHYHSIYGAIAESNHVFINSSLHEIPKKHFGIFEAGFGTGLNALLTYKWAIENEKKIDYYSIEKYPLTKEEYNQMNFFNDEPELNKILLEIHQAPWKEKAKINTQFSIQKFQEDLLSFSPFFQYDIVFFDAFSPNVQPELWSFEIFERIYNNLNPGGILVTYCAKGDVRRNLQKSGFRVNRIDGPPKKRHMIKAIKP